MALYVETILFYVLSCSEKKDDFNHSFVSGGILCGVGGTTSSFRQRSTKFVTSQTQSPHLVETVENYNSRLIKIKEKALQIGRELQEYGNINHVFTRWCQFWSHLLLPGQYYAGDTEPEAKYRSKTNDVDWLLITEAIRNGQNVTTPKKSGRKFSKLKNGESNFLVNGNGLNIDTLLQNAEDAQKTKQHKISKSINDLIKQLEESSPSIKDIDSMIRETMAEL